MTDTEYRTTSSSNEEDRSSYALWVTTFIIKLFKRALFRFQN